MYGKKSNLCVICSTIVSTLLVQPMTMKHSNSRNSYEICLLMIQHFSH